MRFEKLFSDSVNQHGHHVALTEWDGVCWREITYCALQQKARDFSEKLKAHAVNKGERIALVSHNRIEMIVALLGIWFAHATAVLIDPDLPESALAYQVNLADARFVITEECFLENTITIKEEKISTTFFNDCDEKIATVLFTSGTTGDYKGVILTHENYIYLTQFYRNLSDASGCVLTVLPAFHVAGLYCGFLQPLLLGVRIVFFRKFEAEALQAGFKKYQPTVLLSVPRLLEVLSQKIKLAVDKKGFFSKSLFFIFLSIAYYGYRYFHIPLGKVFFKKIHEQFGGKCEKILCGSASLSPSLQKYFLTLGFDLYCSYGLTETCGPITFTIYNQRWKTGSVGCCVEPSDIIISDSGEVLYRGKALMSGYFRDKKATEEAIQNGFFHTKDLGRLDSNKNLYIIGRIKELIVFPDGKKAMPEQIERQYAGIAGVKEFVVFGFEQNQSAIAVLAFSCEENSSSEMISQKLFQKAARLSSPYRIADVMVMDKIPRSSTLKVKRHELAALYLKTKKPAVMSVEENNADIKKIIACFQAILPEKKDQITESITFAELGVDSLSAAQLCEVLNVELGWSLNPTQFWFSQTIKQLHDSVYQHVRKKITRKKQYSAEKIAIVAMTADFPNGNNIDVFWKNLINGFDPIIEVPASRWNIHDYYDDYALAPGKMQSRFGGFISLPDDQALSFLSLKPRALQAIDPRQKIVLLQAKQLLHSQKNIKHTGVFIGAGFSDFAVNAAKRNPTSEISAYSGIGLADFSLASRIAYHFGLTGPAMVINTACSSALVSVHQAIRALQAGDCDAAIAGGVNLVLSPEVNVILSQGGFLSPDGRCKSFDGNANGYVRSDGAGLVLLKRYEDAVSDNDFIHAVIMGSAINQDGESTGLTAPNGQAQMSCYENTLFDAAISPDQIGFIEANGGATVLGDAIEMQSIQSVYDRNRKTPLYVGAVKSVIGNAESAAGIAALIKAILVLKHQEVPPNLHYHQANPHISFENSKVILPVKAASFDKKCEYAAVNAFGISGTNAQLIISLPNQ